MITRNKNLETSKKVHEESNFEGLSKVNFKGPKCNPVPESLYAKNNVKLTIASILREGAYVSKQKQKEQQQAIDLEKSLKDLGEWEEWRERMSKKGSDLFIFFFFKNL
ncbi:hypothetical protein HK096_006373 [Nowakowskiella sp. JEL0078]|nr:hypothetical protein HK096_006373 [Nowakowskiella sp. JEL0078]